ncbi:hypothetical protein IH781_03660 [Patescibacteria group bacterium]|nr:hypothetical protein [Patescibacteria group bacterium]
MEKPEKLGGARLLNSGDKARENHFGQPLLGWRNTAQGERGFVNPRGFAVLWIIVQKYLDGQMCDLYEQPIIIENPGVIIVARLNDKVGLVQNFRLVSKRIEPDSTEYTACLDNEQRWHELAGQLGELKWELPQGIPPSVSGDDRPLAEVIMAAADLEALSEAGFTLANKKIVSRVNANPTFFAHSQWIVSADVTGVGEQKLEDCEMIGDVRFFSREQVRQLVTDGQLDNGLTKAALADTGFHY